MNPDSIRIAIFGVRSADAINPDSSASADAPLGMSPYTLYNYYKD